MLHISKLRAAVRRVQRGTPTQSYRVTTPEPYTPPAWVAQSANADYEAHLMEQYDKQFKGESMGSAQCESSAYYFTN